MQITEARFTTGQLLQATGVANDNLQSWLKRQLIVGQKDILGGGSPGRHRQWTFFNVLEVGAAKALMDAGMGDLKAVFCAAATFAHSDCVLFGDQPRAVGMPFYPANGITLLAAGPDWSEVVFLDFDRPRTAPDLHARLMDRPKRLHGHAIGCVLADMSQVFDRVTEGLGLSPRAVLEAEYA